MSITPLRSILVAVLASATLAYAASAPQPASAPQQSGAEAGCPHRGHGSRGAADVPSMPGFMSMHGRGLDRLLSHIDATAAQKKQIAHIQSQARPELDQLQAEGLALREQAAKLWTGASLDERAIEQSRQNMAAHHEKVSQRMTRFMLDMAKVLTPEQRSKIAEHLQSRHEHMMRRFGGERTQK